MDDIVDMRCPVDFQRMFGRLLVDGSVVISDNLLEFSCDKCRRRTGVRTLHRFDLSGQLVETVAVPDQRRAV